MSKRTKMPTMSLFLTEKPMGWADACVRRGGSVNKTGKKIRRGEAEK